MLFIRTRRVVLGVIAIAAGLSIVRRSRGHCAGRRTPGGILISHPESYDRHSRRLLASLFDGIAADIAATAPAGARILEVGSGPGHLAVRLAREHGLEVTGLDLDPEMVARARSSAEHASRHGRRPSFVIGDVAALQFDAASFDLVVSTFSMHHWSDPSAGLAEIARVLRPDGRALIWDLKPGVRLFHMHAPDPVALVQGSALRLVQAMPWRWPWRLSLSMRLELAVGA